MLQTHDYKDMGVTVNEAIIRPIFNECGAEEHDVVKLASGGTSQLVQKVLCLARVGGPHD